MLLASQDRLLSPATQKKNKLEMERSEGTLTLRGPRRPKNTNTQLQIQLRGIEQQLDSQGQPKSP